MSKKKPWTYDSPIRVLAQGEPGIDRKYKIRDYTLQNVTEMIANGKIWNGRRGQYEPVTWVLDGLWRGDIATSFE